MPYQTKLFLPYPQPFLIYLVFLNPTFYATVIFDLVVM